MTTLILCTDGSDAALEALTSGLAILRPADRTVIVTVTERPDESLVTGVSGFAGGSMSPEEFEDMARNLVTEGERIVGETAAALGIDGAETLILQGHAGHVLCDLATELSADAIVMGSRGRGGIKRALLGSVSDHVVRNAPCAVLITRDLSG